MDNRVHVMNEKKITEAKCGVKNPPYLLSMHEITDPNCAPIASWCEDCCAVARAELADEKLARRAK